MTRVWAVDCDPQIETTREIVGMNHGRRDIIIAPWRLELIGATMISDLLPDVVEICKRKRDLRTWERTPLDVTRLSRWRLR